MVKEREGGLWERRREKWELRENRERLSEEERKEGRPSLKFKTKAGQFYLYAVGL